MKNLIKLSILFVLVIVLAGCSTDPEANFVFDKNQYFDGETIVLTNTSLNASSFLWTLPDGRLTTSNNLSYVVPDNFSGDLQFKLEAFSENGRKNGEISKNVKVVMRGDCVFYSYNYSKIIVTLNNISREITNRTYDAPACGSSGNACFNKLKPGEYDYYATDNYYEWKGKITIKSGECLKVKLIIN